MSDLFGGALFHAFNQLFTAFSSLVQAQHSFPAAILNSWKVHAALNIEVQKSQRTIDKGKAKYQKKRLYLEGLPEVTFIPQLKGNIWTADIPTESSH